MNVINQCHKQDEHTYTQKHLFKLQQLVAVVWNNSGNMFLVWEMDLGDGVISADL